MASYSNSEHRRFQNTAMQKLGFTHQQITALRVYSQELSRLGESACNGHWYRDDETGKAMDRNGNVIPDRETAILQRIKVIMAKHPTLTYFYQTDPRGAALYFMKLSDVEEREPDIAKRYPKMKASFVRYETLSCYYSSIGIAIW